MADIDLPANGWTPRDYQLEAWRATRNPEIKTHVLCWSRRLGKDEMAMHATVMKMVERVGNYYHALPKYSQARKAMWEAINPNTGRVRWKDAFPDSIVASIDNQTMQVKLKNGSTWSLVGSDSIDSLVGTPPVGIVFSEAALSSPKAYAFFRPILFENNGWSMHISTPRGKNHFHKLYNLSKDDPTAYVSHINAETSGLFTDEEIASEMRYYIGQYGEAVGRALFEQEYLASWEAAVIGQVYGQEMRALEERGGLQPLRYDPRFPVDTSWDIGVADETVVLFWQKVGNVHRLIDWYSSSDTGLSHYAEVLKERGYFYGNHFFPHDGAAREWGAGLSRLDQASNLGIHAKAMPNLPKSASISLVSNLMPLMEVNKETCDFVWETLKDYKFTYNETKNIMSKVPEHNYSSHFADALQTYAIAQGRNLTTRTPNGAPLEAQDFGGRRLRSMTRGRNIMKNSFR